MEKLKSRIRKRWVPIISLALLLLLFMTSLRLQAQKQDTTQDKKWIDKVHDNKTVKKLLGVITREPSTDLKTFNVKSEDPYLKYQGKIVRKIIIERLGFNRIMVDTTRNLQSFIAKAADKVHTQTREFVIKNYLYVKEGKPLNPYRVADNERTLRSLDFVMDARIFVIPLSNNPDSVDLKVVTRDVFSLGGSFSPDIPDRYKFSIQEINLAGTAQRVQFTQLYDIKRNPQYGYSAYYQMNNVLGSFIDAGAGYTKLDDAASIGNENESSIYFHLNRPLYQPFTRFAGGVELSNNTSRNVYKKPDSLFSGYRYKIQDYWIGYSFGYKKLPNDLRENRNRKFFAVRAYEQRFLNTVNTERTVLDRYAYRDRVAMLAQLTFFRQDFYKTQYVLGFGITEDIPYGYRISFTTGWEKELGLQRPYLGTEVYYNKVRPKGTILTYNFKLASYWDHGRNQDGLFQFNFTRFSKIHHVGRLIIRHQLEMGYAYLFNQNIKRGIDIRDVDGIRGFMPDSLTGQQRLTIGQELTVFTPVKFLGFRLAPLARIDLAMINRRSPLVRTDNFFSGFSLGVRARNENLIFNTIEARVYYYPKTIEAVDPVRFSVSTNVRIRYPTALVNKPSTVFP